MLFTSKQVLSSHYGLKKIVHLHKLYIKTSSLATMCMLLLVWSYHCTSPKPAPYKVEWRILQILLERCTLCDILLTDFTESLTKCSLHIHCTSYYLIFWINQILYGHHNYKVGSNSNIFRHAELNVRLRATSNINSACYQVSFLLNWLFGGFQRMHVWKGVFLGSPEGKWLLYP